MGFDFLLRPKSVAAVLWVASVFIPGSAYRVERNSSLDIELVKSAECEYRGITASFEELTRAYSLKAYDDPELLGWEVRPGRNPDSEALVTCRFRVSGPKNSTEAEPSVVELRRGAGSSLAVTWHLNTLAEIRITAGQDPYALDALEVFRQTIDDLLGRLVVLAESSSLREEPGSHSPILADVGAGDILLEEKRSPAWSFVRVPSTATAGWLYSKRLRRVYE